VAERARSIRGASAPHSSKKVGRQFKMMASGQRRGGGPNRPAAAQRRSGLARGFVPYQQPLALQHAQGRRPGAPRSPGREASSLNSAAEAPNCARLSASTAYQQRCPGWAERIARRRGVDAAFGEKSWLKGCSDAVLAEAGPIRGGRAAEPGQGAATWAGPRRRHPAKRAIAWPDHPLTAASRSISLKTKQSTWGGEQAGSSAGKCDAPHGSDSLLLTVLK